MVKSALLKPGEAAAALRVSPRTLRNWVRRGLLDAVELPGSRQVRYRQVDIDRIAGDPDLAAERAS